MIHDCTECNAPTIQSNPNPASVLFAGGVYGRNPHSLSSHLTNHSSSQTLFLNSIPALRSRYITYGSRAIAVPGTDRSNAREARVGSSSLRWLLDRLAEIQVPHGYFQHFYIVSVFSSLFWAVQVVGKGSVVQWICRSSPQDLENTMSIDQIALAWALMSIQGLRRLFESATLTKPSTSKMWFVHWLLGCTFYLAVGLGIWIEGTGTPSPHREIMRNQKGLIIQRSRPATDTSNRSLKGRLTSLLQAL